MPPTAPVFDPLSLATFREFPSALESIRYQVTGLMVVFIALGLLWVLMEILGAFFRRLAAAEAASKAAAQAATPAAPAVQVASAPPDLSHHALVAIVAAIHSTLDHRPLRIVSVQPAEHHDWSREGRRDIFSSHRVR